VALAAVGVACSVPIKGVETEHAVEAQKAPAESFDAKIDGNSAAMLAEAYPVPVESLPGGYVSLAAVFVVGTALIYGWDAAVLVAFPTRALLELIHRRPRIRLVYNSSTYALGGAAAGAAASLVGGRPFAVGTLFVAALLAAVADYVVNLGLVAAVIARVAMRLRTAFLGWSSCRPRPRPAP